MCTKTDNMPKCNAITTKTTTLIRTTLNSTKQIIKTTLNPAYMKSTLTNTKTNSMLYYYYYHHLKADYQQQKEQQQNSHAKLCRKTNSTTTTTTRLNDRRLSTPNTIITITNTSRHVSLLMAFISLLTLDYLLCGCNAAPQSCILCDKNDLKAKDPSTTYEEFLFEHQVTRHDAILALKALNESFYTGPPDDNSCKSVTCTNKVMKYCLGPQFINDHCWCELGHNNEGLPFVPHICYVGEKVYTASVGSCFFYEEVKECCCAPALAKQWRHISGASHSFTHTLSLMLGAALTTLTLLTMAGHCF